MPGRVIRRLTEGGNPRALALLNEEFELRPHFEWRGFGRLHREVAATLGRQP
jgi:hydrogenase maturation factor